MSFWRKPGTSPWVCKPWPSGALRRSRAKPEQPFPELPRPRKVIGRKLDQIDRHHPFSYAALRRLAATVGR